MIRVIFLFLLTSLSITLFAQTDSVYTQSYLDRSTKFAWFTYGGDLNYLTGGTTQRLVDGSLQNTDFGSNLLPRLTIGGVHFWGHADLYVTFPLSFLTYQNIPNGIDELEVSQGVETGIRLYPLKIQPQSVRPFVGISFRRIRFEQEAVNSDFENGVPSFGRFIHPVQLGLTYTSNKYHISASTYLNHQNNFDYFISPTQTAVVELNPVSFNLSFLRYVDSDRNLRRPNTATRINRDYKTLKDNNLLSTWFVGVGPSAALQVSKSSYLKDNFPFFYDNFATAILPDLAFGHYFHKHDFNIGLSYRTYGESYAGFDNEINTRRHSVGVESVKFLFNWLGFVPFAGLAVTYENLRANVNDVNHIEGKAAMGFVFGWDIRVTRTGTGLLRTNLRYFPNLHLDIAGEKMMFDQLEFNFIQWVQFLGRNKAYKRARVKK
ncbi:MAG: hypothetical protein AAGI07_12845 [Bacteroidota bacterium]